MRHNIFKTVFYGLALAVFSPFTQAESGGGVIHFRGAIVEDGCDFSSQKKKVSITCNQQGKKVSHHIALADLNNHTILANNTIQTNIRYLNSEKTLAIVSMTYQ